MDERVKFIAGLLDGEKMAVLCRRFGVSRKTGYKILNRYNSCGLEGLTDRSRRPYRHANQLPIQIETLIVRLKQDKPSWRAPKIRERLARLYPDVHTPAISTVHAVLDRHDLGQSTDPTAIAVLHHRVIPLDSWKTDELRDFQRKVSEAGRATYSARVGAHYDLILAVAIALWFSTNMPTFSVEELLI